MLISLEDSLLHTILSFLHASDLMNSACLNRLFQKNSNDENLWKSLCDLNEIKQTSTRKRGLKKWKILYLSNRCHECNNDSINGNGLVKIDLNGGGGTMSRVAVTICCINLCGICLNTVRSVSMKDRKLSTCKLLPNLKNKLFKFGKNIAYHLIIMKIPEMKSKNSKVERKRKRYHGNKYDNPDINNTLLRLIKRK